MDANQIRIIYTLDTEHFGKINWIKTINPIPDTINEGESLTLLRNVKGLFMLSLKEIEKLSVGSLLNRFGENLEAVVLFGSCARGEASELSDIDFFVVVRDLPKEPMKRRYIVYDALTPVLRKLKREVSVIEADAKEIGKRITPLLINIAHDGVIIYDKTEKIASLFAQIREAVKKAGLTKCKTREGKYGWKPSRELRPGEIFLVELEDQA